MLIPDHVKSQALNFFFYKPGNMNTLVYIDNEDITDPAVNLSIEEYALRYMNPSRDYLLLYRNTPSVILGRNQNVLEEVNVGYANTHGIRILRRLSGGGTVYHDPGNLNFCFITYYEPSRLHNFHFFNSPLIRLLNSLGVPAEMNERSDILANGRKISGNAQFSSKGRMFSHGTLLYNARIDVIENVLEIQLDDIQSRSKKSVRSTVANISEFLDNPMDITSFRNFILCGLLAHSVSSPGSSPGASPVGGIYKTSFPEGSYGTSSVGGLYRASSPEASPDIRSIGEGLEINQDQIYRFNQDEWNQIHEIRKNKYETWEWNFGRSPRFKITRNRDLNGISFELQMEVDKGLVGNIRITTSGKESRQLYEICHMVKGKRYDPEVICKELRQLDPSALPHRISVENLVSLIYGSLM